MKNTHTRAPKKHYTRIALIGIVIAAALIFYIAGEVPFYLLWLASTSIVTFILYGFDKMQAKNDGGRVPEIVLHLLALAGGFAGGWVGRFIFRHKTRKPVFLIVLILATALHAGLYYFS